MNKLTTIAIIIFMMMTVSIEAQLATPSGVVNAATTNSSTGNVGIGTQTPVTKLHVEGSIYIPSASTTDNYSPALVNVMNNDFLYDSQYINNYAFGFHPYQDNSSSTAGSNAYISGYYGIDMFTSGKHSLRVNYNGNVGVGTATPVNKLDVNGNVSTRNSLYFYYTTQTARNGNMRMYASSDNKFLFVPYDDSGWQSTRDFGYTSANNCWYFSTNLGIGTQSPTEKLTVKGKILAGEVKVVDVATIPDYVFEKYFTGKSELNTNYQPTTLAEIEAFVKVNHHLPGVPSAKEIQENGLELGKMNTILLEKIEELTLYSIEQEKKLQEQESRISELEKQVQKLLNLNSEN